LNGLRLFSDHSLNDSFSFDNRLLLDGRLLRLDFFDRCLFNILVLRLSLALGLVAAFGRTSSRNGSTIACDDLCNTSAGDTFSYALGKFLK